ncbi:hypothetical protein jhhlp_001859 [Lomentospora prolificans]|uniref:Carboxypeptidase n=1 Tax=Lomentospora prolificans TaxID=41688 RepID=A0A2N3NCF5_9PEZI|nr:hypothetical protein jhhlp_001859 [Lomentospora prolificans]
MAPSIYLLSIMAGIGAASFIPVPADTAKLASQRYPGASIEYKQTSICETTEGVKAYSGYVKLPKELLSDIQDTDRAFDANIFFWYFQARNSPENAPTSIYIAGGPGTSSFDSASNFPCYINEDSNSTTLNEFSWNNNVNMLYIDQPVGVGFSYSSLVEGTVDLFTQAFTPLAGTGADPQTNVTTVRATVSNPENSPSVGTTETAAKYMWKFAQVWFQEFPEHKTTSDEISLWATSYGGFWGPGFFSYFLRQNDAINSGTSSDKNATTLQLSTLGLGNACIDSLIQGPGFPDFAMNNTFGIQSYPEEVYEMAIGNLTAPEVGCNDLIAACRQAAASQDPDNLGNNDAVNEVCAAATNVCYGVVQGAFTETSGRNPFDISLLTPAVYPPEYSFAFFNQRWVQEELGVPLNFTISDPNVANTFFGVTGDPMRRDVSSLEHVLDNGISVALYYGDLDYRCNWFGVERVSLQMEYAGASSFREAGYTSIETNDSYSGGLVRQHGNVSFSRVYDAGHSAAYYQPETTYRIFDRAMGGKDVGTGKVSASDDYSSEGPQSARGVTSELPASRSPICYVYDIALTCTPNQISALADGSAVVKDFIVVEPAAEVEGGGESGSGGGSGADQPGAGSQIMARSLLWIGVAAAIPSMLL